MIYTSSDKLNIAFIFGSASSEYEISCISCASVLDNVDYEKYNVVKLGISRDNYWFIYSGENRNIADASWEMDAERLTPVTLSLDSPKKGLYTLKAGSIVSFVPVDCVFPVMHGKFGEDGRIQGLFDLAGIPVCGCGSLSSGLCMDKVITKTLCERASIPCGKFASFTAPEYLADAAAIGAKLETLGYPLFIKPANAGSSVGITKVRAAHELPEAISEAAKHDRKILAESFCKGKEIEVSVLGNPFGTVPVIASVCGEIAPHADFYDYNTKYINDTAEYFIPAHISETTSDKVRALALEVFATLECSGFARIDFFVDEDSDTVVFNEINNIPGFTAISMYAKLMRQEGYSFTALIDRIIELAMER